jgi:hypothetical protein
MLMASVLFGGACAGLADTAIKSVKDGYPDLKRLSNSGFHSRNEAAVDLAQHEASIINLDSLRH